MDIKEFAQELQDSAKTASEMGNTDYDQNGVPIRANPIWTT